MTEHNGRMNAVCIEQQLRIEAEPGHVFHALTDDVDSWWTHRYAGEDSRISLEPSVGGHFREAFANGGGALYGVVSYVDPGRKLSLRGPMGMSGAVAGVITFELEAAGGGTIVSLSHRVVGEVSVEERDEYSAGWSTLLNSGLKRFVEGQQVDF